MKIAARIYQAIDLAAVNHTLDINLLGALIWRESIFNPDAIGDAGHSIGLGQLHDQGAGSDLTVAQRRDPFINANRTAQNLKGMLVNTPTVADALSAYNQGLGGWQRNGILESQRGYIADIIAMHARLQQEGLQPDDGSPVGAPPRQPVGTITIDIPPGVERAVITFLGGVL